MKVNMKKIESLMILRGVNVTELMQAAGGIKHQPRLATRRFNGLHTAVYMGARFWVKSNHIRARLGKGSS